MAFLGISTLVFGAPNDKGFAVKTSSIRRKDNCKYLSIIFFKVINQNFEDQLQQFVVVFSPVQFQAYDVYVPLERQTQ